MVPRADAAHARTGARVLVVNADETAGRSLRTRLVAWKIEGECVRSGAHALARLREAVVAGRPYTLAILDQDLPEMDELILARAIKADPVLMYTRLVLLKARGRQPTEAEMPAAGLDDYIHKPLRLDRLTVAIERARTHRKP